MVTAGLVKRPWTKCVLVTERHRPKPLESSELQAVRRLAASIGGLRLAATHDPLEYTATARATFLSRFEREVDPDGILPPAERQRRAQAAKKAYFRQLANKSAQSRRRNGKER